MNSIEIFKNESFGETRVTGTNDQPLFCLADLCKVLELTNPSEVKNRLDKDDVQLIDLHALNSSEGITGNSMANFVTESGFYDVILQSSSPRVKPFRKWVTSEVLPAIRKNGGYMSTSNNDTPEEIMARAVMIAQETIKRREQRIEMLEQEKTLLTETIKEAAPKVEYFDKAYHPEDKGLPVEQRRPHPRYPNRAKDRDDGKKFFMEFVKSDIEKIAIENPVGIMSTCYRKPDQIVQPFMFGHEARKATCLWLKGLPKLTPTNIVGEGEIAITKSGKKMSKWYYDAISLPKEERQRLRSKTFQGIADAMADQWG